jgi:MoxR-like ATPase
VTDEAKAGVAVQELATAVADAVEQAIIGKREAVEMVLFALLADGHVLIEDLPGLGKTLLARSFAQVCAMDFARIQFTPDLIPSDITGASIYDRSSGSFTFERGPIFTNILLADEINRAPGKTQAALLEAMEERQVTLENMTRQLESPFLGLATQNPVEYEGTYPLPEAQLDRFLVRIAIGYPSEDAERDILLERSRRRRERIELEPICDQQALRAMQAAIEEVHVAPPLAEYAVAIARATRDSPQLAVGASPRGSLALMKLARARAAYLGRDFVTPDDIKAVSIPALAHRLTLAPELWVQRIDPAEAVRAAVASVPVPVLDHWS